MRAIEKVTLLNIATGHYDTTTHSTSDIVKDSLEVYANVTNLSLEKTKELFGTLEVNAKVVRLPNTSMNLTQFNYIKINGNKYNILHQTKALNKMSFIVKECL